MITKYNIQRMASYKNVLLSSHLFWLHRQFFPQQVLHMCTALRGYNICHIYSMVMIVILLLLVRVSLTQIPSYVVQAFWQDICNQNGKSQYIFKYVAMQENGYSQIGNPRFKPLFLFMKYIYIVYDTLLHQLDKL